MQKIQLFPRNFLANNCNGAYRKGINHQIHNRNLYQNREQLFSDNAFSADRMCQKKFCSPVLFLFTEDTDCTKCRIKRTAKSQYIPTLNCIETNERTKVQSVHPKRCGKRAHGSKHITDAIHFPFHFWKQKNTHSHKKADGCHPDKKGHFPLT